MHLRWLDIHLRHVHLHEMTRDLIEDIACKREADGVSLTTVNRMLEIVRALLRKAHNEWEWLDKLPVIRMRYVEKQRIRWLTLEEANRLLKELPPHLKDMAAFSLATGLRASNVTELQWQDVDLKKSHAWIHPDQAKTKKAIAAMAVLNARVGMHQRFVFTYKNNSIGQCNTKAWRNALERAEIDNFRWHVQNRTSLQELQMLGGWSSFEMVLRYAHLSSEHLRDAADRINFMKLRGDFGAA